MRDNGERQWRLAEKSVLRPTPRPCAYIDMANTTTLRISTQAVCTEAGMLALRERRMKVTQDDFIKAKDKALYRKKGNVPEGLYL